MAHQDDTTGQLTLNDIDIGIRLYEALARHAVTQAGATLAYADLLTLGRLMYPKDQALDRAVPLGVRAKLGFVASFCAANGYPNLASLAVGAADTAAPSGSAEARETERRAAAAFDWQATHDRLLAYADEIRATVPKRLKPRKERPADVAWYAYFCSHREACSKLTGEDKKEIINLLMAGLDPETAMRRVQRAKAELDTAV